MQIAVDGIRASVQDWEAVRDLPREQLPRLNDAQREVARKLGIPEDDYARSALAGQRTQESLLAKTERLARLLDQRVKALAQEATIHSVTLRTWDHKFDVDLELASRRCPLRIEENIVDDLFDSGSREAEERLGRILESVLPARAH